MNRTIGVLVAAAVGAAAVLGVDGPTAGAQTKEKKTEELQKKRTFGWRKKGRAHVQMRSVMAPVKPRKSSKRPVQTPVTVVLTIEDNSKVGKVCGRGPRISDALLQAWWTKPLERSYLFGGNSKKKKKAVKNARRTPEQKAEDQRLLKVINKAVGDRKAKVSEILVLAGTRRTGGGTMSKLPFSSVLGCIELEQKKKENKKKKEKEKKKS